MSLQHHLLALAEVSGRYVFSASPKLVQWARRMARHENGLIGSVRLDDLEHAICGLGVAHGDLLMVHSAWDGMRQLQAKPSDVISMLRRLVGETGTLMMTTAPILTDRDGVPVYNVATSPSSQGLLSESFRRVPDTRRSPCPLGTISAIGPLAETLTGDYRDACECRPYGYGSPYWALTQHNGKVLVLGIDVIRALSLRHCAFDLLGDELPISEFYEALTYIVVRGDREESWSLYRQHRQWDNHCASAAFAKMIDASGTCQSTSLNGMSIAMVDAKAFVDWHLPLVRQDGWPIWGARLRERMFS